jgi:hypothetical protein
MSHKTDDKHTVIKTKWVEKPSSAVVSMNNIMAFGRKLGAETERRRLLKLIEENKLTTIEQIVENLESQKTTPGVKQMLEDEAE